MAALAGAAGGAAAGGLTGALIGMGIPEYEAKRCEGKVKDGNILMSVNTEDGNERERAKEIFVTAILVEQLAHLADQADGHFAPLGVPARNSLDGLPED